MSKSQSESNSHENNPAVNASITRDQEKREISQDRKTRINQ